MGDKSFEAVIRTPGITIHYVVTLSQYKLLEAVYLKIFANNGSEPGPFQFSGSNRNKKSSNLDQ